MKEFWNQRFSEEEYIYGTEPNEYFKEVIDQMKPGKLLLPAEGEGRNAIYAAKLGWEVTAFDQSESGKQKALNLAKENGVTIDYQIMSISDFEIPENKYDAIGLIYAHFPSSIRSKFHNQLVHSLNPNGVIILEAFNPKQLKNNSGGPKDESLLYPMTCLEYDFEGLEMEELKEVTLDLSEGKYHLGKADVVRMKARKK